MNRIAKELLKMAAEVSPQVKVIFERKGKEERDLTSAFMELQRFVTTIHKNEEMPTFIGRTDDDDKMTVSVGFSDHSEKTAIVRHISDMAKKIGTKLDIAVESVVL